jgi:hypothetical protein
MLEKLGLVVLSLGLLSSCGQHGNGSIGVDLSVAGKEYCREISFPDGWRYPLKDNNELDYPHPFTEYEFREGPVSGELLVAGAFEPMFSPRYTTSKYRLNLSSTQPTVAPIDIVTWEKAAPNITPLYRKSVFPAAATIPEEDRAEFQGKTFSKTGPFWPCCGQIASRLSPDRSWLVLQSTTKPGRGNVFFDVYNLRTGAKLVTLEGPLQAVWPDELIDRTGWLAGRYFVIPTGDNFEGSVICDFGRGTK